ncbi:MAG: TetR/AcrR family transcriptional regulator [Marinilabiliales bacterium]
MCPRKPEQYQKIREEKKSYILKTALKLFAENGYHSTSISKIASNAGISKGLIYNYFNSKEDLLKQIFNDIVEKIMTSLDPNKDEIITNEEANNFFDVFFESLVNNPEEWKLIYQLSIQQEVMDFLIEENHNNSFESYQKIIFDYFKTRNFKDPELSMLIFSSLLKGFVLQYAFAPDFFPNEMVEKFKNKLKEMFVAGKTDNTTGDDKLDDLTKYILL